MAPADVDVVVERTGPEALQPAVARLCEASVDVIAYASTTTGYTIGRAAELELVERLHHLSKLPAVTTGIAATQALGAFGVRRVAVFHPPWFDDDIGDLAAAYFRSQGFDVAVTTATSVPKDPQQVRPEHVIDWVSSHVGTSAEAIFIAGNGFRAAQAIEMLEHRTGQLVVEANQVLLYSILAATRTTLQLDGYGRLLGSSRS
ncbi:maleate cis-trans isomerase [Kribbella capetownensis]|uniref:Maleate cis-trans isomerase n=1 Tax=Kribbella capetownensis TaxID=1572659 RepID=A0A4R0JYV6_9ACTN|nr:maleate cis-trans isomerase [Kribbella capetownensis]TCC52771.1 maleate cis-trans isomerase [Kribbella capetownensis]